VVRVVPVLVVSSPASDVVEDVVGEVVGEVVGDVVGEVVAAGSSEEAGARCAPSVVSGSEVVDLGSEVVDADSERWSFHTSGS
jgi:hypothetical protein